MKHLLKEYVREILREAETDKRFTELLNKYVTDSRRMDAAERKQLSQYVSESKLSGIPSLERISETIPYEKVGDTLNFNLASFTKVPVSTGKNAGNIGWKYSDKCIFTIKNPTRGLEVNYDLITAMFDASNEKEVIVTGTYKIASITNITEPGTNPNYGYEIPLYELQELQET